MRRNIIVELSDRVRRLTPSGLGEISALAARRAGAGRSILRLDVEDLGWTPPPLAWVGSGGEGAVRRWMADRLGCASSSSDDVLVLRGPLAPHHVVALAFVNPGDAVLVPDPGPPILRTATLMAGGIPVEVRVDAAAEHDVRDERPHGPSLLAPIATPFAGARPRARLQFFAPFGPPTGSALPPGFIDDAIHQALLNSRILVEDLSGLLLDLGSAFEEPSAAPAHATLLGDPRGSSVGVALLTFDALFGAGRSPFSVLCGNRDLIAGARRVAVAIGLPVGAPAARSVAYFLAGVDTAVERARPQLIARREELANGLLDLGLLGANERPAAGFTIWARLPRGYRSLPFTRILLRRAGVLVRPGPDFGASGEGRIAVSFAVSKMAVERALDRLDKRAPRKLVFERRFWSAMREIAQRIRSR